MSREIAVIAPRGVARGFDPVTAVDDWRAYMAERVAAGEMASTTATTYARGMLAFLRWHEDNAPAPRIGPGNLRAWKAAMLERGITPAGVNVRMAGVRSFFRWAVAERGLAYDPAATVPGASRRTQSRRHRRDALSVVEVRRVLAQPNTQTPIGRRDLALITLMAYTGARSVEVQRARLGDLQTIPEGFRLEVQGKGRTDTDEALYLVKPQVLAALHDWLAIHPRAQDPGAPLFCGLGNRNHGGPITLSSLRAIVKACYLCAGVIGPRKTAHSLRHTFVTQLVQKGVAPIKIMAATRHRSLDTMLAYVNEVGREADPAEGYIDYGGGA